MGTLELILLIAICVVILVIFAKGILVGIKKNRYLQTEAKVLNVKADTYRPSSFRKQSGGFLVQYTYQDQAGRNHKGITNAKKEIYGAGDKLVIFMDPADPEKVITQEDWKNTKDRLIGLVFVVVLLVIGTARWFYAN